MKIERLRVFNEFMKEYRFDIWSCSEKRSLILIEEVGY